MPVLRLILAFVDIMLHRRGPEDLPASQFLLWAVLTVAVFVNVGILLASGAEVREAAVAVLITMLDLWFVWALLRTFNRERRFRQTMTAWLASDTIINLLTVPLLPLIREAAAAQPRPEITLPVLLMVALYVWSIDVASFVFSRALERPYLLCVAIVLGYALLITSLHATLVPAPVAS